MGSIRNNGIYWDSENFNIKSRTLNKDLWLAKGNYANTATLKSKVCSHLIDEYYWTEFKNSEYGENIVGAIGTPTLELFAASWNEKRTDTGNTTIYDEITLNLNSGAYNVNGANYNKINSTDKLYASTECYWLASPAQHGSGYMFAYSEDGDLQGSPMYSEDWGGVFSYPNYSLRPVVCLKASTPAKVGTTTDIELVK